MNQKYDNSINLYFHCRLPPDCDGELDQNQQGSCIASDGSAKLGLVLLGFRTFL